MRRYDLVLFGATGRTGRQIAEELGREAASNRGLRWAIAGRDRSKLREVADRLPVDVGVLHVDLDSSPDRRRLARKAAVVLNAAGPYSLSADPLISACISEGTDYLDITGETAHVRRIIDRYHPPARRNGSKIVPFCGFDSVPSDLGVLMLVDHFRRRGLGTLEVKGFFRILGRLNSGTLATVLDVWRRPADLRAMRDPHLLEPHRVCARPCRCGDPVTPFFDDDLGRWVGPFWTAPISTRVVRRSRALMSGWGQDYGCGFRYQEYWDPGGPAPWLAASTVAWGMATYRAMTPFPDMAERLAPIIPAGDEIPSDIVGDGGFFRGLFVAEGEDGSRAWSMVAGRGDPSNQATVRIVVQCALALALERGELPGGDSRAGVLTPATAFGLHLVPRLREAGLVLSSPLD